MQNRSPRFPFLPLSEAIDLVRKLDAFQKDSNQPLKRPEMLKALDYASFHGAAAKSIAALRAYDLLRKNGDGVSLSPVAREILDASSDEERLDALQRAALSPLTFRMMWRRARHSSRKELRELLMSREFTEPGAKRASRIYKENDELAGLEDLELEPSLPERRGKPDRQPPGEMVARKNAKRKMAAKKAARKMATKQAAERPRPNALVLPLSKGNAIIPKGITKAEFKMLMETLRTWRSQLVAE